jgi:hypothetical protein
VTVVDLVVALDDDPALACGGPRVHAERADAEVVAKRLPVGLLAVLVGERRDGVEVGGDDGGRRAHAIEPPGSAVSCNPPHAMGSYPNLSNPDGGF